MAPVKNRGKHKAATASITGISIPDNCSPATSGCGDTSPDTPSTHRILKTLLPTTLPTAISRSPLRVAITEVITSGNDVPAAMMVSPITASLTPNEAAILTALSTNQRDPSTKIGRASCRERVWIQVDQTSKNNN